jgi:hypothetical protein
MNHDSEEDLLQFKETFRENLEKANCPHIRKQEVFRQCIYYASNPDHLAKKCIKLHAKFIII